MHQTGYSSCHMTSKLSFPFFHCSLCNKLPHCRVVAACKKITGVTVQTPTASPALFCHLVSLLFSFNRAIDLLLPFTCRFHRINSTSLREHPKLLRVLINYHNKSINNHITTNISFCTVTPKRRPL
jgi:hypothetical protein